MAEHLDDTSSPERAPKFKKESSAVDDLGTEYEVSMLTLLFMRGLNHSAGFHLACNHKDAHPFDDAVMEWRRRDGSTMLLMMQLKHKRDKKNVSRQELLTSAKKDLKEVWNHQKYGSFRKRVEGVWKEVVHNDVPKEVLLVLCKNVKLDNRHIEYHNNLREIIGESGEIEQFLCSDEDVVEKFNDLDGDFLTQFSVLHNLKKDDLENATKEEIKYALSTPENLTEIFGTVKNEMKTWWRSTGKLPYLTEKWEKWSDVVENQVKSFNEMFPELHTLRLRFSEDKVSALCHQLPDTGAVAVVSAPDESLFTTLKVRQALSDDKHLLVAKWPTPEEEWRRLVGLWRRSSWCRSLVLCVGGDDLPDREVDQLLKVVSGDTSKRLILVSDRSPAEDWHIVDGRCSVSHLDEETQGRLKNTTIDFQGTRLTLGELLDDKIGVLQMSDAAQIDACCDGFLEVGRRLPKVPQTFVDRTLFRSCHLRTDFFSRLKSSDFCVLTDETSSCDQEWLPPEHQIKKFSDFVGSAEKSSNTGERAWILFDDWEADSQFQYLCDNYKDSRFYWIESDTHGCKIRRTNCGVELVKRFVMSDRFTGHSVEEAIDSDRVTLLTGGPGMGKSTVTSWVTHEIKRKEPSMWVIVLNPVHCLNLTPEAQFDDLESVTRFLCTAELHHVRDNGVSETLLRYTLQETNNTAVIIDETDDLPQAQYEKFRSLVRILLTNNNIRKVWVASRGLGALDIEEFTGSLSFRIGEFTIVEKKKFYDNFEDRKFSVEIKEKFVNNTLFSTPLFANLFLEGVTKGTDADEDVGVFVDVSDQNKLFEKFIEMKLKVYFEKRSYVNEKSDKVKNILHNAYYEHFTYEAAKLLLSREQMKKLNLTESKLVEILEDIGIITNITKEIRGFVHRTFAEFFLARWFAENSARDQQILKEFFHNKLFHFFCEIFNRKLCKNFVLHEICANGEQEKLKPFLQDDVSDLRKRDKGGRNLLHICSIFNSVGCAKHIIKRFSFWLEEHDDVLQWTPLKYAVNFHSWGVLDLFLEADFPYDKFMVCLEEANIPRRDLYAVSCMEGHKNILKQLVSGGGINRAWRWGPLGLTALHLTLMNGQGRELVGMLLRAKVDVRARNVISQTALHMAVMKKDSDVVRLLMNHGADVNVADCAGLTPLHCAALAGNEMAVRTLLKKNAKWRLKTSRGETALHLCGSDSVVRTLLAAGLRLEARDSLDRTPLHYAAGRRAREVVKALLDKGADVMARDKSGNTPLHSAVLGILPFDILFINPKQRRESDTEHVMQLLIDAKADVNAQNSSGESPLHLAMENGSVSTVRLLVESGADLYCRDNAGRIPQHRIAQARGFKLYLDVVPPGTAECYRDVSGMRLMNTHHWFVRLISAETGDKETVIDYLIQLRKLDVTAQDNEGMTVLHHSILKDNEYVICKILDICRDVNTADYSGITPLHLAAFLKQKSIVERLISNQANVNAVTENYITPLVCACLPLDMSSVGQGCADSINKSRNNFNTNKETNISAFGLNISPLIKTLRTAIGSARDVKGTISVLLDNQADTDASCNEGWKSIHFAAFLGCTKVVRILFERGVNLEVTTEKLATPLYLASFRNHEETVMYLLSQGANVNATDCGGYRPLHAAAQEGHMNITHVLLKAGADVDAVDNEGQTALHAAANEGHVDVVRRLLCAKARVNTADNMGNRPLHVAAFRGHIDVVDVLIKDRADVDSGNNKGQTALYGAALEGHVDVVRRLLRRKASVNTADELGNRPLLVAALRGHVNAVDVLVNAGTEVDAVNNDGQAALHAAAQEGHVDVVRRLLRAKASVNTADNLGTRPLYVAALRDHIDVVDMLIKAGADVDAVDNEGQTALHAAANEGHLDVVRRLLHAEASVNTADELGNRPLYVAALRGHIDAGDMLIKAGADVDAVNNKGQTALYAAALGGHVDVVRRLLHAKASVNTADNMGNRPLYVAALRGHVDTVDGLVNAGAEVDAVNNNGQTALYTAARKGHVDVVRRLLSAKASVNGADELVKRPL